ncbi:unnamed protein product, partial [marine sediment metagenome]
DISPSGITGSSSTHEDDAGAAATNADASVN